jgi:hypothetical protein
MNDIFFYIKNTLFVTPDLSAVVYLSLSIFSIYFFGLYVFFYFSSKKLPVLIRWSLSKLHSFLIVSFLFLFFCLLDIFYFDYLEFFHLKLYVFFVLIILFSFTFHSYYTFSKLPASSKLYQVFSGPIAARKFFISLGFLFAIRKRFLFFNLVPFVFYFLPILGPTNLISIVIDNSSSMGELVESIKLDIVGRIKNNEFKSNTRFLLTSIDHESSLQPLNSLHSVVSADKEKLSAVTVFCEETSSLKRQLEKISTPETSHSPIYECVRHNFLNLIELNTKEIFDRRSLLIFTDGLDNTLLDSSGSSSFCMMQVADSSDKSISSYYNDIFFISYNYVEGSKSIFTFCPQIKKFNGNSSFEITEAITNIIPKFLLDIYFFFIILFIVLSYVISIQFINFIS